MTHYQVLGIPKDASAEDIGKAFRSKARKWHPDRNKTDGAEERFKRINEAYQVLSDPAKRKEYDESLQPKKKLKSLAQTLIEDPKVKEGLKNVAHSILDVLLKGGKP